MKLRSALLDAGLALVVAAITVVAIRVAQEAGARPPDAVAYLLGVTIGALLLLRRQHPMLVLCGSVAALMTYYILLYPGIPPAVPLAAALYSVAAAGRLRAAMAVAVFFTLLEFLVRHFHLGEAALSALANTFEEGSLLVAVVLLAETVRSRREGLARLRAEREREAAEERLRIARDVHDLLGHTISAITVQAGLADDVFDSRPAEARAALRRIRSAARDAMGEVRATVGALRGPDGEPMAPAPGLDELDRLYALTERSGVAVHPESRGAGRALPATIGLAVYRIVQESLTNTVRHAGADTVTVLIDHGAEGVRLEITDNGRAGPGGAAAGHGITGMTERAVATGGTLTAGPVAGGGFRVSAWLPVAGAAAGRGETR